MSVQKSNSVPKPVQALGFVLVGIIVVIAAIAYLISMTAATRWPTVTGQIVGDGQVELVSTSGPNHTTSYHAVIHYEYTVNGASHQGSHVTTDARSDFSPKEATMTAMVNRYPNGAQVTVYYNPDDPSDAFLEGADVSVLYLGIGIGIFLVVIGVLMKPGLPRRAGSTAAVAG